MKAELAIYRQADAVWHVLLEDGRPVEYLVDDANRAPRRQDIFLGQIRQVTAALDCVFIDIGEAHDAMLPLAEAGGSVKTGQPILVQIRRETSPGKGHQVTTHIQLPGPFAVYRPHGSPKRRSKLRAFPEDQQAELFGRDLVRLEAIWQRLLQESRRGPVPRCLLAAGEPLYNALISFVSADLQRILVEGEELFRTTYDLVKELMPPYLPLLSIHVPSHGYGLEAVLGLTDLADSLLRRKVWLDHGGFLVIDRTEALTVIDVNSGKDVRGGANQALRQRTNQEAAIEIARQLRLRNLGGIIIIDFLDLDTDEARTELLDVMTTALARDRAKHRLVGFTGLGLLELTRTAL